MIGSGVAVLAMTMSTGLIGVSSMAVLSARLGSPRSLETTATLMRLTAAVGVATMVTVAVEPLVSVPRLQTTGLVPLHAPWVEAAEPKARLAGRGSVRGVFVASSGPEFVTAMVYVSASPAKTRLGVSLFATDRAAVGMTVAMSLVVLSARAGSNSLPATAAVLVIGPSVLGVTTIVQVATTPLANAPMLQATTPPASEHPAEAELNVAPPGRVSVITAPVASDGPAFVTTTVSVNGLPRKAGL